MKLEFGNFYVKDIVFSDKTEYDKGILSINKEELIEFVKKDERIIDADIHIVSPGDLTRICPVKEAIEPRIKIDDRELFPGYTGDLDRCGEGITHTLKNCSLLVVGKKWGGFQDGLIDMGGEGAKYTYFSKLKNIVLVADTNEDFEKNEQQKKNDALRKAGHKLAQHIAKCVKNLTPDETESYELEPITKRSDEINCLPSVVFVMQLQSQMEEDGYNALTYGWNTNHLVPTLMHPNEILDGAIVSGSFMPCSSKWSTYDIQNAPIIKKLYKEHGKTLNFLGVILSNLNVSLEQKERSALYVAQIAKTLGADGAIVAEEGYGNPDADFVGCIVALEDAGVKVVGMTNECTGRDGMSQPLVTLDEKLDAIVSCGNVSQFIELGSIENIIGDIEALSRDGLSGGWPYDEILGPSVRADKSIIMENNAMFCGDQVLGWSNKTMKEF